MNCIAITQLRRCGMEAAMEMVNGHGCVPVKPYAQNRWEARFGLSVTVCQLLMQRILGDNADDGTSAWPKTNWPVRVIITITIMVSPSLRSLLCMWPGGSSGVA